MTRSAISSSSTATEAYEITPDDDNDLAVPTRGIYVGVSGDLKVDMVDVGTVTFVELASGMIHSISAKRVYSTGTDAASILGLY